MFPLSLWLLAKYRWSQVLGFPVLDEGGVTNRTDELFKIIVADLKETELKRKDCASACTDGASAVAGKQAAPPPPLLQCAVDTLYVAWRGACI